MRTFTTSLLFLLAVACSPEKPADWEPPGNDTASGDTAYVGEGSACEYTNHEVGLVVGLVDDLRGSGILG